MLFVIFMLPVCMFAYFYSLLSHTVTNLEPITTLAKYQDKVDTKGFKTENCVLPFFLPAEWYTFVFYWLLVCLLCYAPVAHYCPIDNLVLLCQFHMQIFSMIHGRQL